MPLTQEGAGFVFDCGRLLNAESQPHQGEGEEADSSRPAGTCSCCPLVLPQDLKSLVRGGPFPATPPSVEQDRKGRSDIVPGKLARTSGCGCPSSIKAFESLPISPEQGKCWLNQLATSVGVARPPRENLISPYFQVS